MLLQRFDALFPIGSLHTHVTTIISGSSTAFVSYLPEHSNCKDMVDSLFFVGREAMHVPLWESAVEWDYWR